MKSFCFLGAIFFLLAASCSVNYDTVYETEGTVPELMLDDAVFSRVRDSKSVAEIQSKRLEEFKDGGVVLAKDIQFTTKTDGGEVSSFGSAGLMKADPQKEVYEFFNGIKIEAPEKGLVIEGESLRWNGKSEQLVGERGKPLTIKKDGMTLRGSGFSASAVSQSFSFSSNVSGIYVEKKSEEKEEDGQE